MKTSGCLQDPFAPTTPRSQLDIERDSEGEFRREEGVEYVPLGSAEWGALVDDNSWRDRPGAARGYLLYRDDDEPPAPVVVKKRTFDGQSEPLLRWQCEVAVYDTSRQLLAGGSSLAEDINEELERVGHPGRVPVILGWWLDRNIGPDRGGIALTRLAGTPLQDVLDRYPEGLPQPAAAAIVRSLSGLVYAAHRVGVVLGDISSNNALVDGDVAQPASLHVNFVDLELAGPMCTDTAEDRETWAPLVDAACRWRLECEPLSPLIGWTERMITLLDDRRRFSAETDLGYLGRVAYAAFAGKAADRGGVLPPDVPGPLRWLLAQVARTGDLPHRIRRGRGIEVATAGAFGHWVDVLARQPEEDNLAYLRRLEREWAGASSDLRRATCRWADESGDPIQRLWAARVSAAMVSDGDNRRVSMAALRHAADTLSSVSQDITDDQEFAQAVDQSGILPDGAPPAGTLLERLVSMLSPAADRSVLARVERLWPGLAAQAQGGRPAKKEGRLEFLSGGWLEQLVAHAPVAAAGLVEPRSFAIALTDDRDRSFTFTIDDQGRLSSIERGTTRYAQHWCDVSVATLADHLSGRAYFPEAPVEGSNWWPLWRLAHVAPSPTVIRGFTDHASWPRSLQDPGGPFRFGCAAWLDGLVDLSAHLHTEPQAPPGHWAIDVTDDPSISFTFLVSEDRRLVGWKRGVLADAARTTPTRRSPLIERLMIDRESRPRERGDDALSVLCRVADEVGPLTDLTAVRQEFLSAAWLVEFHCGSQIRPDQGSASFAVVPREDPTLNFEVDIVDGALTALRPLWGRPPGVHVEYVPAGRLWDALVEGLPVTQLAGRLSEPLTQLAAFRPPNIQALTGPCPGIGCPPGEAESTRRKAEEREQAERDARRSERRRTEFRRIIEPARAEARALAAQQRDDIAKRIGSGGSAGRRSREMLADMLLERGRLVHDLRTGIQTLRSEMTHEAG